MNIDLTNVEMTEWSCKYKPDCQGYRTDSCDQSCEIAKYGKKLAVLPPTRIPPSFSSPPVNGDHISLDEILEAHHRALTYNHAEYALDILFDSHRGVDVYHALNREAELGNIVPLMKDEKMNYIVRFRPTDEK